MKRFLKWFALGLIGFAMLLVFLGWWHDAPRPTGTPSAEADALAQRVLTAVDHPAWAKTGALEWTFAGRNTHLWDKDRGFARVRWDETEVLLDLRNGPSGSAREKGQALTGGALLDRLRTAYKRHINDRFWLYPFGTFFDAGVTRALATDEDGQQGLLISYSAGGVTPGDAYLWFVGEDGLPTAWRMWVDILPIGGISASWGGWQTLSTGLKVATAHEGVADIGLTGVKGAATLLALTDGTDPFAELVQKRGGQAPTSQPSP